MKPLALKALQTIYERTQGAIPLIGCGGISTGADALDFAKAGASAIELYTSFGYTGVGTPRRIKDELTELLRAEGKTWREVVGTGAPAGASRPKLPGPGDGGPRPEGLTPNSDDAFRRSVASVKSELENLRSTLSGGSEEAPAQTATPFHPPKDDVEYNDLLARVHAALASPREEGGARLPIPHADTTHTGTEGQKAKQQLEEALKDPVISPAALQEGAQTDATVATGQSPTSGRLV